ncbi:MAG: hypothetical protein KKC01_11905 [Gammaproteobacteria bacterium]|nr:hypothetical protein [Gammaproteobacteria bacterium]
MKRQQLEQTLREDATRLPLDQIPALQQRVARAVRTSAHTQASAAQRYQPARLRSMLAIGVPALAALLLLISLPTHTPPTSSPAGSTVTAHHSNPTLVQLEQQLQRQLASDEQALLQEWQHIDQDWQRTRSLLLPVAVMK